MAEQIRMSSAELAIRLLTGGESLKSREEAERLLAEIRQSTRAEVLREAADRFDRENDDNEILRGDYPGAALRDWAASSSPSPAAGDKQPETSPWQRAVDGLNALVDADIPFHIEPDGHISNPFGDEHIEWDRAAERWQLTFDDEEGQR